MSETVGWLIGCLKEKGNTGSGQLHTHALDHDPAHDLESGPEKIRIRIKSMIMSKKKPELLSQPGLSKTLPRKCR